ncbi:hypothetical protein NIES208_09645 [[Limnothrix rosea] IAM M-220]|nr:hypothetical protein NIES208_09645 [[Limnothrix rosea] IAM M-220]
MLLAKPRRNMKNDLMLLPDKLLARKRAIVMRLIYLSELLRKFSPLRNYSVIFGLKTYYSK